MKYRVTFIERNNAAAQPEEAPADFLDFETEEGVVLDKTMVARDEPAAVHNEESLEEDDDFLSMGSESWDFDIADGRHKEFLAAVKRSGRVLDCVQLDDQLIAE